MRVMAGSAGEPDITFPPTLAAFETIRLGPGGGDAFDCGEFYVPPCAVARAAEVNRVRGMECGRVEDGPRFVRHPGDRQSLSGSHVLASGAVTGLAGYAWHQFLFVKPFSDGRRRCVTSETPGDLRGTDGAEHSLLNVLRGSQGAGGSKVNRL